MGNQFDPYAQWLGVRDQQRPLNHYRLLGLNEFEPSAPLISQAAEAMLARVRSFRPGPHLSDWQKLLDELSVAKLCLSDAGRKGEYDEQLRAALRGAEVDTAAEAPEPSMAPVDLDRFPPTHPLASPGPAVRASSSVESSPAPAEDDPMAPVTSYVAPIAAAMNSPSAAPPVASQYGALPTYRPSQSNGMPAISMPMSAPIAQQALAMPPVQMAPPIAAMPIAAVPITTAPVMSAAGYFASPPRGVAVSPVNAPGYGGANVAPQVAMPVMSATAHVAVPVSTVDATAAGAEVDEEQHEQRAAETAPLRDTSLFETPGPYVGSTVATLTATRNGSRSRMNPLVVGGLGALAVVLTITIANWKDSTEQQPVATTLGGRASTGKSPTESKPAAPVGSTQPAPAHEPPLVGGQAQPAVNTDAPTAPAPQPETTAPAPMPDAQRAAQPESKPEPKPKPEPPKPDPEQAAAFAKMLGTARGALAARNPDRAKKELDAAGKLAASAEQDKQLSAMLTLNDCVAEFWKAVRESLKVLQPTDELKINNTVVAVVEVTPESLLIRAEGGNRSYTVANMPVGIAMMLAQRSFDEKAPTTKLFLGAFHAVDPNGDLVEARRLWEEATAAGASAADLMPILETPAGGAVVEQGPVPDKTLLAQATKAFKAQFQQQIRGAKSRETKLEFARQLLTAAIRVDNPAERYVLYREARDLAVAGADAALIERSIDDMSRWFEIDDAWTLKAEALKKAGAAADAGAAKALAASTLKLAEKAVAEKRLEQAGQLSHAALVAARKSHDAALVKQVNERDQQIQEMLKDKPRPDSAGS